MILRRGERHSHAHKSSGKSGEVRLFLRQLENVRHSTEFWKRTGLHLPHQIGSMHLHRRFSDTHIVGHLFVESAGRGLDHDLALTGAKRVETFPEHSQRLFALLTGTIASQTSFDCIEKVLITERFREELYGPPFHCLHGHRDVAVRCDEDDWQLPVRGGKLAEARDRLALAISRHEAGRAVSVGIGIEKLSNR